MGYDVNMQYIPRLENRANNALSRMPPIAQFTSLTIPSIIDVRTVKK